MLHTPIGTPLKTPPPPPPGAPGAVQGAGVTFQRMPAHLAAQSQRIIQLGALGVQRGPRQSVSAREADAGECKRLIGAIEQVTAFLVQAGAEEGVLEACAVVRGALREESAGTRQGQGEEMVADGAALSVACPGDAVVGSATQSPDVTGTEALECPVDDDAIMAMLIRESGCFNE
jgi:hypothetical protein